ncbi:MAG: methyl-accepting chemotaxis protein [Deltaproteobacteria bacterium]|nr:methyl-accepting chemotaxis protein [Deltaproteobacteria bacterium]
MKDMKLGAKIALGFGILILIAGILGVVGVWEMGTVEKETTKLAQEYVPEVDMAVDLRGGANRMMYAMRGYAFTEDKKYYDTAQKELQAVETALEKGRQLEMKSKNLKALKGQLEIATQAVDEYKDLVKQSVETVGKMQGNRKVLDTSAEKYMINSNDFLAGQNQAFKKDLAERQKKVEIVTDIVNLGTKVRVNNFKAQATNDMELLLEAMNLLRGLKKHTKELRPITRDAGDIKRIEDTEAAAEKYSRNMMAYLTTANKMITAAQMMDAGAAEYMKNCNDFLVSQNEAMQKEFTEVGADLDERLKKITLANEIIDLGNAVRVMNFKAQATQDPALMEKAAIKFKGVIKFTGNLREITRKDINLKQIDNIESAAGNYISAMEDYLKNYMELGKIRTEMNASAGQYVAQCESFLEGQQKKLSNDMYERNAKISLVNDIIDLGNDTRVKAFKSQALKSPAIMEEGLNNFPKIGEKFGELKKITRLDADLKKIDQVEAAGNAYNGAMTNFLGNWNHMQDLGRKREDAGKSVISACRTTADAGMKATSRIANEAMVLLQNASWIMIAGLIGALVFGILIAFFITRSITVPIRRIIQGLSDGSAQVAAAAEQVSAGSQSLAEGASEQAAALEESSSSLEEMSSMTKNNADNANEAKTRMGEAGQVVDKVNRHMGDMADSIGEITQSSEETGKIIKTIDEIAFQTNLLALNAAVEAARAGEAGAGFAVVADEVRNLALRAADAAKNTTDLIENTIKSVKNGNELTQNTQDAFKENMEIAGKVGSLVDEITAASNEQAQGIEEINRAVSEMDKVVQQVAANAEESASASEEMNAQAEQMQAFVGELVNMVGGSSSGGSTRSGKGIKKFGLRKSPKEKLMSLSAPAEKDGPGPEDIIPMDDDNFKEF